MPERRDIAAVRADYERRLENARLEINQLQARGGTFGTSRLVVFGIAAVIAWLALSRETISIVWILVPVVAFIALVVAHERLRVKGERMNRLAEHHRRGIARLDGDWSTFGSTGDAFRSASHPYADDLDLFGRGSLFQLLSLAHTAVGERTLAAWLLNAATVPEILERQQAVDELRNEVDLRAEMSFLGETAAAATRSRALTEWSELPPVGFAAIEKLAAPLLAIYAVGSVVAWIAGAGSLPFIIAIVLETIYFSRLRARVKGVTEAVDEHLRELMMLREVIATIGSRRFESPLLRRLWSAEHGSGAAAELQRLVRLIDLLDAPRNQFFAPFGALLMWTPQVAFALERWRQRNGASVRRWLESVGAFEALLSLAGFAYEHPDDAFPEVSDHPAMFEAHGLAHPLLPQQTAIANHVSLSSQLQLLIVSGSNMSGKSTLLRSVGVNAILAQAGSVVRAQHLRMSPLVIGASIRINDSLQEGSSRFYAEVTRVKTIVELASSGKPMLFLLDEIFNGTNSHDRRIGAEAVLKKLVATGAIGLVTTHDLALARLAEALATARNVHFEDHLENGVMAFDYRLKPGVVEKSNALELMRAVGLDV